MNVVFQETITKYTSALPFTVQGVAVKLNMS